MSLSQPKPLSLEERRQLLTPQRTYTVNQEARKAVDEYAVLAAERDVEKMVTQGTGPAELATDKKLRAEVLERRQKIVKDGLNAELDGMADFATKNGYLLIDLADEKGEVKKRKVRFETVEDFQDFQHSWVRVDMPDVRNELDFYQKQNQVTLALQENKGKLTDEKAKELTKINSEVAKHGKAMNVPERMLKLREYTVELKIIENKAMPNEKDGERSKFLKGEMEKLKTPPKIQEERENPPPRKDDARFTPEADPAGAQEMSAEMFSALRAAGKAKDQPFVSAYQPPVRTVPEVEKTLAV